MKPTVENLFRQSHQLLQSGQLEAAASKNEQILALEPDNPMAHFQLGMIALQLGRHETAVGCLSRAIELNSSQPKFHDMLGIAYSGAGDLPAGERCFLQAIELDPGNPVVHHNLAGNYRDQCRWAAAADCYRKAIALHPQYLAAHVNLGRLLSRQGELAAAVEAYRKALDINTELPEIRFELAATLLNLGQAAETETLLAAIIAKQPRHPGAYNMRGSALTRMGRFEEAIASYRKAVEIEPGSAPAHGNLANALLNQNDVDPAIASYRSALALQPNYATGHSNMLMALNYLPDKPPSEHYQASLQFAKQHTGGLLNSEPSLRRPGDAIRRLRVGYVSPDFRMHSVAHFTLQLMGAHDRNQVEVYCYSNVMSPDEISAEFRAQADHWVSIVGMDDDDVAARIRAAKIDILVDLAGHTADNRLLVFARKPAPVQVTWLGYPNTTGLACMDYRLTDAIADPPGAADRYHTEQLIRLPHGFLCYQFDASAPEIATCPYLERGHVTFGSLNNLPKLTPEVVRVWSRILTAVPDARLILKSRAFADEQTRVRHVQAFQAQGIAPERLDLLGIIPDKGQHLATYSKIDIGLDPFPYNGTTTTCEALWMGVPVISLCGDRHASRVGASILHHVGLPELVADSEEAYIAMAVALAADRPRLAAWRQELRPRMRESVLMDTRRFTRSLEHAYREMWKTWCNSDH